MERARLFPKAKIVKYDGDLKKLQQAASARKGRGGRRELFAAFVRSGS